MKHRIDIKGSLIPNDYKFYYDYFEMDSTAPKDVQSVIDALQEGDTVEVYINSPGGVIDVGSEIYTMLRTCKDVQIYITGEACSAASIVAMAGHCSMSPTALMMVHCVSTAVRGNHSIMEHTAEMLGTADRALCTAYMEKAGMSQEEALTMMEKETWLTAKDAKERGLIDEIMFEENTEPQILTAGPSFTLPSGEMMDRVRSMLKKPEEKTKAEKKAALQFKFLCLKGEKR